MSRREDDGATAVEYGLMIAAIAAVIVGVAFGIGTQINTLFAETKACLVAEGDAVNPCLGP